jgi:hypothetical protein
MMASREPTRRAFGFSEFARMFDISRDTAKRLAKSGDLRTIYIAGRRLVPLSEIERIEKEGLSNRRKAKAGDL